MNDNSHVLPCFFHEKTSAYQFKVVDIVMLTNILNKNNVRQHFLHKSVKLSRLQQIDT